MLDVPQRRSRGAHIRLPRRRPVIRQNRIQVSLGNILRIKPAPRTRGVLLIKLAINLVQHLPRTGQLQQLGDLRRFGGSIRPSHGYRRYTQHTQDQCSDFHGFNRSDELLDREY
jgi:hypothetical protein